MYLHIQLVAVCCSEPYFDLYIVTLCAPVTLTSGPNWREEKFCHQWAPSFSLFSPSGENRERTV